MSLIVPLIIFAVESPACFCDTADDDGSDLFIGAGLLFGWDALKFRGSFTRYEVADEDLDTFSAGVQYFFAL